MWMPISLGNCFMTLKNLKFLRVRMSSLDPLSKFNVFLCLKIKGYVYSAATEAISV